MSRTFDELLWEIASGDGSPEAYKITKGLRPKDTDFILENWDSTEFKPNEDSLGKLQRLVDMINLTESEDPSDYNPTGIGNPADYIQSIKFTDSDENGKPESVEIEKKSEKSEGSDDPNVLSDKGLKDVKDEKDIRQKRIDHFKENWGETDEMKRKKGKQ